MTSPADAYVPAPWRADVNGLRWAAQTYGESVCRAVVDGYADMPFVRRHAAAAVAYAGAADAAYVGYVEAIAARSAA